jgi:hypothetical protein
MAPEFERRITEIGVAHEGRRGPLVLRRIIHDPEGRKKEIGRDLFAKMCRDLKIDPHEL